MSIIRVIHNRENPYVLLNKKALWDENLSLKAVGLWARCLSRPNNWRFNVKELAGKCKEGRKAIDAAIKELIEHGYAVRINHWNKDASGKFNDKGFEYIFFEFQASQEDKDKVLEEFKKSFHDCCFGNLRNGNFRNGELIINTRSPSSSACSSSSSESEEKKEESNKPLKPEASEERASPISADAEFLTDFFLSKIKERRPEFKEPNRLKWSREFDCLLRIDKRDLLEVKALILWASEHNWWKTACLSPAKLRKDFDTMAIQMSGDDEKQVVRDNRAFALKMKEQHPKEMKGLTFDSKFALNSILGKDIPFNLPRETFEEALIQMFGGEYVPGNR